MKIALCGRPCSGKSAVAKLLSEEFALKHFSTGDFMRSLAMERGYTIEIFAQKTPQEIDRMVDAWAEHIGKTEEDFIIDSRLAFHFIPDALKIFLDVSYEEGARRIFLKQRVSEAKAESVEELTKRNQERWDADRKRYIHLYSLDIENPENYDLMLDTTGRPIEDVIAQIRRALSTLQKA